MRLTVGSYMLLDMQRKENSDSIQLSWVISCMLFLTFIVNLTYVLENWIAVPHETISITSWGIMGLLLAFNFLAIMRNLTRKLLVLTFSVSLIFLVNYMFVGNDQHFIQTVSRFIFTVYPLLLVYSALHNYEQLYVQLVKISKIILVIAFVALRFSMNNLQSEYSMGYSYSLQLPVIIMLCNYYRTKEINYLILAIAGIIVILLLGARGPLLGIIAMAGLLYMKAFDIRKNVLKAFLLVLFLVIFFMSTNLLLQSLNDFSQSIGIQSRSLTLILNDNILHASSRDFIYHSLIQEILAHPFRMHGIAGEYAIIGGDYYAHNFILELLCDFGVIFGSIIFSFILVEIFRTLRDYVEMDSYDTLFRTILLCAAVPSALISGTIWGSASLWVWLFILKKPLKKNKLYFT